MPNESQLHGLHTGPSMSRIVLGLGLWRSYQMKNSVSLGVEFECSSL